MPRRLQGQSGFTLLEGLFSLLMVLMVLGALSSTLRTAADVKKNTRNMGQAIEEFHTLFTLKKDALGSVSMSSPARNSTTNELTLNRVNPDLTFTDRIDPLGDPLDPFEASEQVTVDYRIDEGYLKRFYTAPAQPTTAERLLRVESFECVRTATIPSLLTITIETENTRVSKTRVIKVALKGI